MGNVDWGCLAVQVAIKGIAFFLINMLILYKDVDGRAATIRRDDHNLFLSLLLAILVGYWATTLVKPDCVSVPYIKQEGKEDWNPFGGAEWGNLGPELARLSQANVGREVGNQLNRDLQNLGSQAWDGIRSGGQYNPLNWNWR
jgi:hypothetical protein